MIYLLSILMIWQINQSGELVVEVKGIDKIKGNIRVALYNVEKDFLSDKTFKALEERVDGKICTIKFADVPYGTYAISVYHDENENGELDTGLFGIPKEGYGFSNDVMGTFGPPSFEEAAIDFQQASTIYSITLR